MSTHTAFNFWVTLAVISLTSTFVLSSQCFSCPCGSNGQNYTLCSHDAIEDQHTCEIWANCQTCTANTTFCSSCPPNRFGSACSEVCGQIPRHTNRRTGPSPKAGDWPWTMGIATVSPEGVEDLFCGGVILNSKAVLTTAQCVLGAQNIILLFGTVYPTPTGNSGSEQKRRIFRVIIHPDYDNETKANDIALLKFETELNFSQTIQPICLPDLGFADKNLLPGQKGLVPGWGYNYTMYMFIPAVNYEVANVTVQPENACMVSCQRQGLTSCPTRKTFCAYYPKGVDACMYRGAPMVIYDEEAERYSLAGLVTRKLNTTERNCRRGEVDTVLTNVSHFMPFILQNLS